VTLPAERRVGPQRVQYTEPLAEVTLFEHASGLAVLLNDFSYSPGRAATLTVKTGRAIKEVVSSLRGALEWKQDGDSVVINCPVPDPVDTVILK